MLKCKCVNGSLTPCIVSVYKCESVCTARQERVQYFNIQNGNMIYFLCVYLKSAYFCFNLLECTSLQVLWWEDS